MRRGRDGIRGRSMTDDDEGGAALLQDLRALVQAMGQWRKAPVGGTYLIVLSPGAALPQAKRSLALDAQICEGVGGVIAKRGGQLYRTSPSDLAVLLRIDQNTLVSVVRDLKIQLLRAIETHCANSFGCIDQSRLVIAYDLIAAYRSAAERVSKYAAVEQAAAGGEPAEKNLRPFTEEDARNVMLTYKEFGPEKFVNAFVRHQPIVLSEPNRPIKHLMNEYFISMDLLRKRLFIDVEMRGSGHVFNDFTLVLDQIFLRAFDKIPIAPGPFSINLNVETVFTKAFEIFLDEIPKDVQKIIMLEFRQANIVDQFDEFMVARGLIQSRGIKIAVDRIFPNTVGLVDLEYLGATMAKVHWRSGADDTLIARTKALKYMVECGVNPVIIRVDDRHALEVGAEVGVERFQGFLIDDMMRQRAA